MSLPQPPFAAVTPDSPDWTRRQDSVCRRADGSSSGGGGGVEGMEGNANVLVGLRSAGGGGGDTFSSSDGESGGDSGTWESGTESATFQRVICACATEGSPLTTVN